MVVAVPAAGQTATITGRITDAVTGAPLGHPASPPFLEVFVQLLDASGSTVGSAATDAGGVYTLTGIAPGSYYLRSLNSRGYADQTFDALSCTRTCPLARTLVLAAGETRTVDFALQPSAVIAGVIRDRATRAPIPDAVVSVYDMGQQLVTTALSNNIGVYSTSPTNGKIPAGTYYAVAESRPGYAGEAFSGISCGLSCRLKDAIPIRIGAAQTIEGIDFLLERHGSITGRVVDAGTSAPITSTSVVLRAQEATTGVELFANTGADGGFTFADVPPGNWRVMTTGGTFAHYLAQAFDGLTLPRCTEGMAFEACAADFRAATPVTVRAGESTGGVNFALRRGTSSIAGTVTRAGQPYNGARVVILDRSGAAVRNAIAGPGGGYVADGLMPGTYFVHAGQLGFNSVQRLYASIPCDYGICVTQTGTPVTVTEGMQTGGIDFDLPATGRITGSVQPGPGPTFFSAFLELFAGERSVGSASVNDGVYSFDNVAPGTYHLRVRSLGFVDQWYGGVCGSCGGRGQAVTVTSGNTTGGIDFQLDAGGKIEGTLRFDSTNRGTFGLFVEAFRADGTVVASTSFTFAGNSQPQQAYTIEGVPPGSYFVRAGTRVIFQARPFAIFGGDYATEVYPNVDCDGENCPLTGATQVQVTAGATTSGIDLTLNAGGVIDGRVVAEGQALLKGSGTPSLAPVSASVQAYTADGRRAGNLFSFAQLQFSDGHYAIKGLHPGRYFLKATGPSGYAPVIYKDLICPACSPTSGTPVIVPGPVTRDRIDFTLLPTGMIAGRVTDGATGEAIDGVRVTAYAADGSTMATALTNILGAYRLANLGAGKYFVGTSNLSGYADEIYDDVACGTCDPLRGRGVEVQGGRETEGVDFRLTRGAVVAGHVRDAAGARGGLATVSLFNSTGALVARATASEAGVYAASVPAGTTFARLEPRANIGAQLYDGKACPGGTCDPTTGTPIVTVTGQTRGGVDFSAPVCAAVTIAPQTLPVGSTGTPYSAALGASPGGPFTFALQSGTLPPGVTVAASGALSGTPGAPGRYAFRVGAADAAGCGTSRDYTIDVTSCTPALGSSLTFDVAGALTTVQLSLDGSCPAPIAFNASWLSRGRDLGPGLLEAIVAQNPGGRRTGTITIGNRTLTINQGPIVTASPFGSFDTPADGVVAAGSIPITGWVLDDLRVLNVRLFRSAAPNEPPGDVFLGNATLVPGARPDVEHLFPEYPYGNRAGWGYLLLTNMLPNQGNGTFAITAIAEDADRHVVSLGTRTIVANNAAATQPFGAIDTPQQGETISGASYVNFGWALTPQPKTIPPNGSTIRVFIDGAVAGTVSYNHFRQDIASLFPGLNNTNGAVGFRMIDTTALADGLHTIAWVVTDDSGASEGIGSRYFTVENGSAQFTSGVLTPPRLLAAPASALVRQVFARELEPISIDLAPDEPSSCRAVFSGVERVGAEQRALPVGSSLDRERGTFKWQPGPGFIGTYRLSFDVGQCDGNVKRIDLEVTIERSDRQD